MDNIVRLRADEVKVGDRVRTGIEESTVEQWHTITNITFPVDRSIIFLHTLCCGRFAYGISESVEVKTNGDHVYCAEFINPAKSDDMPLFELEPKRYPSHDCMLTDAINRITEVDPRRFVIDVCIGNSPEGGWEYTVDYMDGEGPYRIRIEQVD